MKLRAFTLINDTLKEVLVKKTDLDIQQLIVKITDQYPLSAKALHKRILEKAESMNKDYGVTVLEVTDKKIKFVGLRDN